MPQNRKIAFKKKVTPTINSAKSLTAPASDSVMRLIADAQGNLLDVNVEFATVLNIRPSDLINRNLMDTVLFKDFDEIIDDRALFNNLSFGENTQLSNIRPGLHTLLIGQDQSAYEFQFDWVNSHQGQKYLVASSISYGIEPDWSDLLNKLDNNINIPELPKKKIHIKKEFVEKISNDIKNSPQNITNSDLSFFTDINRNIQCVLSFDGTILRHNDIFSEKNIISDNNSFLSAVAESNRAETRQYIQSFARHDHEGNAGDCVKFEAKMNVTGSQPLWIHWRIHQKDNNLYCLGHDITNTKMVELSLVRREQELSEAQALANMGHWRWVVGSEFLDWSEQIYKIFGMHPDNFSPTLDNVNSLIHKRDIGRMMQAFQRAIIEHNDYDIDFRVIQEDQSIHYVQCEGRCELDDDGEVIALYGVMQDVTEQTQHEMELRDAKDAAEQAYASKSRFLANMSHELRTPLNAIIGFSDMINRQMLGAVGNEKYLDYAENIKHSGEHLLALITDILDMSKIEAGKYELDLEKIQLGDVINTAVRMIESRAHEGEITLRNNTKNNKNHIIADRRAVMQILLNILSNAVKFTKPDGTIDISIDTFENHISIQITDNGIGIPANKLSAVLRPFEQVSTEFTRNHEGSGLGLAITKELAELHGGMIALESTVGVGTSVFIRLPKDASK